MGTKKTNHIVKENEYSHLKKGFNNINWSSSANNSKQSNLNSKNGNSDNNNGSFAEPLSSKHHSKGKSHFFGNRT